MYAYTRIIMFFVKSYTDSYIRYQFLRFNDSLLKVFCKLCAHHMFRFTLYSIPLYIARDAMYYILLIYADIFLKRIFSALICGAAHIYVNRRGA